ncbi:DUF3037 domain-containing protein [Pararoseomonas sp. SCSIO 73927]|uniref:DUF3037 domain-containing protein n=1 Tax=Pararoseomonas sp. SCSIO 73927 TaxID=3114537 RepID=UPI0030CEF87E
MTKAFYSLIQFCPDIGRQETFNVGLVLFRPEPHLFVVRLARNSGVNARFDVGMAPGLFEATKQAFRNRLEHEARQFRTPGDLAAFKASGTNQLRLTAPREVSLHDPVADSQALFDELVGADRRPVGRRAARGPRVGTRLREALRDRAVLPLVEEKVQVVVPALRTTMQVAFAYQNGRYNLVEPVDFSTRDDVMRQERTAWYALGGRSLFEEPDPQHGDRRLVVVARLPDEPVASRMVSEMLQDNQVHCFPLSDEGLDRLASEIRTHAALHHV